MAHHEEQPTAIESVLELLSGGTGNGVMTTAGPFAGSPSPRAIGGGGRRISAIFIALAVFWVVLFLIVVANSHMGVWVVKDTGVFFLLLLGALFLCALGPLVGAVVSVVRKSWAPLVVCVVNLIVSLAVVLLAGWLAFSSDEWIDRVLGEPASVAHYNGTQNSAALTLRTNGRFDLFWSKWPGTSEFFEGTYEIRGAELRLRFREGRPRPLPDRALIGSGDFFFEADGSGPSHRFVVSQSRVR